MTKVYVEHLLKTAPFIALLAIAIGLAVSPYELSGTWSGSASKYLAGYLFICGSLFFLLRYCFPVRRNLGLMLFGAAFLIFASGMLQVLATLLFLFSSCCLGVLVLRLVFYGTKVPPLINTTVLGIALYSLFFNAFLSVAIHYQVVYLVFFSLPIIVLFSSPSLSRSLLQSGCSFVRSADRVLLQTGRRSFFAFILVLVLVAAYVLFPNINSDENGVHLGIWTQFSHKAFFTIDPTIQVWSAAPNTFAVLHGVLSLLSGGDAKAALNIVLLFLLLGVVFKLLAILDIDRNEKLALTTLFLTTPLVVFSLVGLQTDLFLALLFTLGTALLIDLFNRFHLSTAIAIIFIGSLALSAKLPAATIAAALLVGVIWAGFKHKAGKDWSFGLWMKIVLCLFIAASLAFWPYVRAYVITGNPVFPLYNEIFKSDLFEFVNFRDNRWYKGVSLSSFYGLFFDSAAHIEAENNFVGGFQFFLLAPLAILVALFLRAYKLLALASLAVVYLVPMFFSLQYLRYFFAALPLLSVVVGVFYLLGRQGGRYRKWLTASFYTTAFINIVFMPGICWLFFLSPFSFLQKDAQTKAIRDFMPEQLLNKEINRLNPDAVVLSAFGRSFGATLTGMPIYDTFYAPSYSKIINTWKTDDDVRSSLKLWSVDFLYWNQNEPNLADEKKILLHDFLVSYGKPVAQVGDMLAFSAVEDKLEYRDLIVRDEFASLKGFNSVNNSRVSDGSLILRAQDAVDVSTDLSSFTRFKYTVEFTCENVADSYIAYINWGKAPPYYKLINCDENLVSYTEVGLIPAGTKMVGITLSVRAQGEIKIHKFSFGAN
jgi:hypothetical protein